jgi:hypothetical protein
MRQEKGPRAAQREGQIDSDAIQSETTSEGDLDSKANSTGAEVNDVRNFLMNLGGPWHICPAVHWQGYTFHDIDKAVEAIGRANEQSCVYFLANTPIRGRLNGRTRRKTDIAQVNAVFLDVDDPDPDIVAEFDRLGWRPTYVAFTGGGWQAMWRLHGQIFKNHVAGRTSHVPYEIELADGEKEPWITILSGPADNPFINQEAYVRRLREACHGDPVRLQQWLFGDWTQGEGLLFPAFDPDLHVLSGLGQLDRDRFHPLLACDWGISSPSVALLGGRARRDMTTERGPLPKNSVIVWAESTDAIFTDENLNTSSEWPPDRLAERIDNMCADNGVRRPTLTVDSARGLQGDTVQRIMQQTGHFWSVTLPRKGRRSEGWADVNSRLLAAAERNPHRPHLYMMDTCRLLLATLPSAVRDERDPDDWHDVPHCPDHAGDALRYLLADARVQPATFTPTLGVY